MRLLLPLRRTALGDADFDAENGAAITVLDRSRRRSRLSSPAVSTRVRIDTFSHVRAILETEETIVARLGWLFDAAEVTFAVVFGAERCNPVNTSGGTAAGCGSVAVYLNDGASGAIDGRGQLV